MPITETDRKALVALIESYGGKALRAVGLAHRDISAKEASKSRKELLSAEDLEHDLVLDAIVVSRKTSVAHGWDVWKPLTSDWLNT